MALYVSLFIFSEHMASSIMVMFLFRIKGFEDAKPIIAALNDKGVTAIGAAGFCWGGTDRYLVSIWKFLIFLSDKIYRF